MELWTALCCFLEESKEVLAGMVSFLKTVHIRTLVEQTQSFRHLSTESVLLRPLLALLFGGIIGLEREKKNRPAGFRTYMVVCLGATLTMILGQYQLHMLETQWLYAANATGAKTDITRFAAQVINGVGFLSAGTILITGRQQIKGLTTAASLWASACMGLVIGAAFYECAFLAAFFMIAVMRLLPKVESVLMEKARNMNIYIEVYALDGINDVISSLKSLDVQIYDVDIERGKASQLKYPNAVFSIRLNKHQSHTEVIALLSELACISVIKEI
jgi:putative Mg2+ transporter-C (MgtC) family protein